MITTFKSSDEGIYNTELASLKSQLDNLNKERDKAHEDYETNKNKYKERCEDILAKLIRLEEELCKKYISKGKIKRFADNPKFDYKKELEISELEQFQNLKELYEEATSDLKHGYYRSGKQRLDKINYEIFDQTEFIKDIEFKISVSEAIKSRTYFDIFFQENGISDIAAFSKTKRFEMFRHIGDILTDTNPNRSIHRIHTNEPSVPKFVSYFINLISGRGAILIPGTTYDGIIAHIFEHFKVPDKKERDPLYLSARRNPIFLYTNTIELINEDEYIHSMVIRSYKKSDRPDIKPIQYVFMILPEGRKEDPNLLSSLIAIKDGLITRKQTYISTIEFDGPKVIVFSNESQKDRKKIPADTLQIKNKSFFLNDSDLEATPGL